MGDRRRVSKRSHANQSAASSSQPPPEPEIPLDRYKTAIYARKLNPERTMANLVASPSFMAGVEHYGLRGLLEITVERNEPLVYQYHVAYASTRSPTFVLRNQLVPPVTPETFADMFGLRMEPNCVYTQTMDGPYPKEAVEEALTFPGRAKWKTQTELSRDGTHHMTKNWQNFLASNVLPMKHMESLRKGMNTLIYLIMQGAPLCFPTIMCREFHRNAKDFKLKPKKSPPSAINFPHFVTAFCELHRVPVRGLDYFSAATSYVMKSDQNMANFPRPDPIDLDEIFGDVPSPPRQQQQQDPASGSREIPLDQEFLNRMHEEIREEQHKKTLEDLVRGQKELREDMDEIKGGMRALLRHFRLVPEDVPPRRAPSTSAQDGGDEDEDDEEDDE